MLELRQAQCELLDAEAFELQELGLQLDVFSDKLRFPLRAGARLGESFRGPSLWW